MKKVFVAIGFCWLLHTGFSQKIKRPYPDSDIPPVPVYTNESNWVALPWTNDMADTVPVPLFSDNQDQAAVDVFYIYPTMIYAKHNVWNADVTDKQLNQRINKWPIKHQASIFNVAGKVYAPLYRQANYESFMALEDERSQKALEVAYQDVKRSFLHYMETWNHNRPFIIAGHSQGTFHAIRLIKELIDTTALLNNMVSAYLVGMPIQEGYFEKCKPCQHEYDTRCFNTWNTMKRKNYPDFFDEYFKGAICHNPLSWDCKEYYCEEKYHSGGVPGKYNLIFDNQYGTTISQGVLWVDAVKIPGIPFSRFVKNWHIGDYNLFWVNVRQNVAQRVQSYLEENQHTWPTKNSELEVELNIQSSDSE